MMEDAMYIKKVIVTTGNVAEMKPPEKITFARDVNNTCKTSTDFQGSPLCQGAMAVWMAKTDALEKNQQDKKAALTALGLIIQTEGLRVFEYEEAASAFASAVQTTANGNALIAKGMAMPLRTAGAKVLQVGTPTKVGIATLKTTGLPRLEWAAVPGAVLYMAQMSVDPATDTSWVVLYGNGKSRALPPLTAGQHYLFRVCAIASDGQPSAWSTTVSFVGK
jgi:hypothetical protein